MNIIAGILGYLAAVGAILGVAIFGMAAVLQEPSDTAKSAAKSPPPLVRAADRKPSDAFRGKAAPATVSATTKAAAPDNPPATATIGQAQTNEPQPAKKQAKVAKPRPKKPGVRPTRESDDGQALGFAGPPRGFVSPFFR
jgi:hypothetical protein